MGKHSAEGIKWEDVGFLWRHLPTFMELNDNGKLFSLKQKRERPAGSPPVTGFASFRNTITEFNIAELTEEINILIQLIISICSSTAKIPLKY